MRNDAFGGVARELCGLRRLLHNPEDLNPIPGTLKKLDVATIPEFN